jgi:hypothetical protein
MKIGTRALGLYKVTYASNGFVQHKILISDSDWYSILKPLESAIHTLEDNGKPTNESISLKQVIASLFGVGQFFKEGDLYHQSIKTGYISLPKTQGGDHSVSWELIS